MIKRILTFEEAVAVVHRHNLKGGTDVGCWPHYSPAESAAYERLAAAERHLRSVSAWAAWDLLERQLDAEDILPAWREHGLLIVSCDKNLRAVESEVLSMLQRPDGDEVVAA